MADGANDNDAILDELEALGGGYVWEPEIFAVTLVDVDVTDTVVKLVSRLVGVEQVVVNAAGLSPATLKAVASIPGLHSLLLTNCSLSPAELDALRALGPEVELTEA
jgi:hypothetical protein